LPSQIHLDALDALASGRYGDPFDLLGVHKSGNDRVVMTLQPQATGVSVIDTDGNVLAVMERIHKDGVFAAALPPRKRRYLLRIESPDGTILDIEDPYRFPSALGQLDLHLLGEGSHQEIFATLGAHITRILGVDGTRFAVWAPNASRVSVVGDFNDWDGRRHMMRLHSDNGIWEIFIPGVIPGAKYKFEILDQSGTLLPLKSDPLAHFYEPPPGNASIVYQSEFEWSDGEWMDKRRQKLALDKPVSIYEVHPGSWRRRPEEHNRSLSYRELAQELVAYTLEMGFTHIELLPVSEHPFDGSWGYQPIGMYAPTQRFGKPDDFRYFVDCCHKAGLSVIVDWVPAHFPKDSHGLAKFDGTALYEHEDPRKGEHSDWDTLIFNYGRREVVNYLIGSALYWIDQFHIDALRVDAVASMLYLDYSRKQGEWLPNEFGGNENLEAVAFLRRLNEEIHEHGASSFAEESTAWPGVSHPTYENGLGFSYKWNMGWMNDTLSYMSEDPIHRKHHHDKLTFSFVYAFSENFVLPISHDEVVHGKGSMYRRMPGDTWQKLANLRAYYALMFGHPGKKLIFMGCEFGQINEWNHDQSLDWDLLEDPLHKGLQVLIRDLNQVYRCTSALHCIDFDASGFNWINADDRDYSVIAFERRDHNGNSVVVVSNLTPVPRESYRIGMPSSGTYRELLNTDASKYGGSGTRNPDGMTTEDIEHHGQADSLSLALPPLATMMLVKQI